MVLTLDSRDDLLGAVSQDLNSISDRRHGGVGPAGTAVLWNVLVQVWWKQPNEPHESHSKRRHTSGDKGLSIDVSPVEVLWEVRGLQVGVWAGGADNFSNLAGILELKLASVRSGDSGKDCQENGQRSDHFV